MPIVRTGELSNRIVCTSEVKPDYLKFIFKGQSGNYPELVYNVEASETARAIANEVRKLLRRAAGLNEEDVISLDIDFVTTGWADSGKIKQGAKTQYWGAPHACFVEDLSPQKLSGTKKLRNGISISSNPELACARAADFNRLAGIDGSLSSAFELLGIVADTNDDIGSSRGVDIEMTIRGYPNDLPPIKLCLDRE